MSEIAEVTIKGLLSMQVCVPKDWTDEKVKQFAEAQYPSGTTNGWFIRREGDKKLEGMPERNPCSKYQNKVHIMLDR